MYLEFISFIAGILTIFAPCGLFLLPIILFGSSAQKKNNSLIIVLSLGVSVFLFSILIKGTSLAFVVPDSFWNAVSGVLIILFSLGIIFPSLWSSFISLFKFDKDRKALNYFANKGGPLSSILFGVSLGPIFTTCSPTFAILLAIILPNSFLEGGINIAFFVLGMMLPFLLIGFGGHKFLQKIRFIANPNSLFKKIFGIALLIIGIFIVLGLQKDFERILLDKFSFFTIELEQNLIEKIDK